jgi:hypothetical protein
MITIPDERRMRATVGTLIAVVVAGLAAVGCGGSESSHHTTRAHTTTPASASTVANIARATTPTVSSGPVHGSLRGASHSPTAGKEWAYTVRATGVGGKPLSGTVETEFAFAGTVVGREAPPKHRLRAGLLRDSIRFPPAAVGHPITLVTVIRTPAGSVALGWPVTATR